MPLNFATADLQKAVAKAQPPAEPLPRWHNDLVRPANIRAALKARLLTILPH